MTLLQKTCAFARPRAASLVVSALLKAPVPISNVYCCISNDRVSQSCAATPRPIFPLHARSRNALFLLSRFFFFLFCSFFFFFAPNHAACIRSGIRIDTDTDIPPPSSDPIRGWWSLYRPLSPSRASPSLSLLLSLFFSPSVEQRTLQHGFSH